MYIYHPGVAVLTIVWFLGIKPGTFRFFRGDCQGGNSIESHQNGDPIGTNYNYNFWLVVEPPL